MPASSVPASSGPTESVAPGLAPDGHLAIHLDPRRLPLATTRSVAFTDGAAILLAGGLTTRGTIGTVIRIPIGGGALETDGSLGHPVHDAAGVTLGGAMLVLGGGSSTQDSWVQRILPNRDGKVVGLLPAPRADLGAVIVGQEAIVVGGGAAGRADPRVLATVDGVHFRVVARLKVAVRYAAVAAVGGEVFIIGGSAASGDVATIQVVDVATGATHVAGELGVTRSHATALVIDGAVIVAGGRHGATALNSIVTINPVTARASPAGRLPIAVSDAAGVVVDGVGYLIGGEGDQPLSSIVVIAAV